MRSRAELVVAAATLVIAAACTEPSSPEGDEAPDCDSQALTYQTTGAPFVNTWCRGCHASALPADMRQGSPAQTNFDSLEQVRAASARILARATGEAPTMPPAGGPSAAERERLARWLRCGAP